jgi:hypothetical protein
VSTYIEKRTRIWFEQPQYMAQRNLTWAYSLLKASPFHFSYTKRLLEINWDSSTPSSQRQQSHDVKSSYTDVVIRLHPTSCSTYDDMQRTPVRLRNITYTSTPGSAIPDHGTLEARLCSHGRLLDLLELGRHDSERVSGRLSPEIIFER